MSLQTARPLDPPISLFAAESVGPDLFATLFLVLAGVVILVSIRHIWRASAVYRADGSQSLPSSSSGDLVRLRGTAEVRDGLQSNGREAHSSTTKTLKAPFTGSDALVLRYTVEERTLGGWVPLPQFVTLHETAGAKPFLLRTETEHVAVGGDPSTVVADSRVVETVSPAETPSERVQRFEDRVDTPGSHWRDPPVIFRPIARLLSLGTRRYAEERVGTGDRVTVVGRVVESTGLPTGPDDTGDRTRSPGDSRSIDPLVVSTLSPWRTFVRMTRASTVGLLIGSLCALLGVFLLLA